MDLQVKSTYLLEKLKNERNESSDYRYSYNTWSQWWNLSGTDDIAVLPQNSLFKYVLKTSPFDYWEYTLTPEYIIQRNPNPYEDIKNEINSLVNCMENIITLVEKEKPHTTSFVSIPTSCGYQFELVGLAKISNNGTSYVFSNDLNYLKYLKNKGL